MTVSVKSEGRIRQNNSDPFVSGSVTLSLTYTGINFSKGTKQFLKMLIHTDSEPDLTLHPVPSPEHLYCVKC